MGVKTIIIDDSKLFREILKNACTELACNVISEFDRGDTFLAQIGEGKFSDLEVLFLDINMPGLTGKELLDPILNLRPDLTVIMISTFSDMKTVDECLDLGATNYINKDTHIDQMKNIIQKTLQMSGFI